MAYLTFDCRFRYANGFALSLAFDADDRVTALVGPSGCGKTTALNLIAGLLVPDAGNVSLDGITLFDAAAGINRSPDQRQIGYVFQDYQLFPHLSVLENLRYGERRTARRGPRLDKVLATLELEEFAERRPSTLSGGQQQRVAIGRAILRGPKLLLLDEPVNALDAPLRESVSNYLKRVIAEFRIPALLVSHDRGHIANLASTTVEMAGGYPAG
jgi:molybdate transport system ATP-binding protein